jgi:hypothetical protein
MKNSSRAEALASARASAAPAHALTLGTVSLREELAEGSMTSLGRLEGGGLEVEVALGRDSLWALIRRPGRGGLALRCAHAFGGGMTVERLDARRWRARAAVGEFEIDLGFQPGERAVLRCTAKLTPSVDLLVPYLPRDLYPLSNGDDPDDTKGCVEAAQRGLNTGLLFLTLREPAFGGALYVQNLTALNPYFEALQTTPDGAVGGEWPELGYQPPTSPTSNSPPVDPLPRGEPITLSDALIAFESDLPEDEQQIARQFLDLLATSIPSWISPRPSIATGRRRAEATLRDLAVAQGDDPPLRPHLRAPLYGRRIPRQHGAAGRAGAHRRLRRMAGEPHPLEKTLKSGLGRFYDQEARTMRRYLPNVGDDKDADAVDSWYLYHPLTNLARLAEKRRRQGAHGMLRADSLDFAIKAAHHFDYAWPIQFNVTDFSVITASRNKEGLGQTDVGGIYAYLMLQAHGLFGDERYLDEAKRALIKARGAQFELGYQANLTAWGSVACLKLWRMTGEEAFRQQSCVFLASFFHNSLMWESSLKTAKHFPNFLGVTCLHDAPYMAMYECYESVAAFDEYLAAAPEGIDRAARLLVTEYRRFAFDRAWHYYPTPSPRKFWRPTFATATSTPSSRSHWKTSMRLVSRRDRWARRSMAAARPSSSPPMPFIVCRTRPSCCSATTRCGRSTAWVHARGS